MGPRPPVVSVIMPAFNAQRFIEASVRSVLEQTFPDFELLVIDDCSTDATGELLAALAAEDGRIRVLKNRRNSGVAASRNRGVEEAGGEYLALLDSDDLWHREKLERQLRLAEERGADIVCSSYALVDETGRKKCADFIAPETITFESMLRRNEIGCSTVLLRRAALGELRFSPEFYHEDYALWLQLLRSGRTAVGERAVLMTYRCVEGSRSSDKLFCARQRWRIYRRGVELGLGKSLVCMARYGLSGLIKYRGVS